MSEQICIHCFVSGKVQGVWYRANTGKEAKKRNLTGWARNLADGRVEVIACGSETDLASFEAWLRQGPPKAKVENVLIENLPAQVFQRFQIR